MEIQQKTIQAGGIKFFVEQDGKEVARAFLYILKNGLHDEPFGFMEDVFVEEAYRSQGLGKELVKRLITAAKENGCYKILGTSRHERPRVHAMYEKLGFKNQGAEFRIDF